MAATTTVIIPAMRPWRMQDVLGSLRLSTTDYEALVVATGACADIAEKLGARVIDDGGGKWSERINLAYQHSESEFIFTGADDIRFQDGWLTAAIEALRAQEAAVAVVNDLLNPAGTMALVTRKYIDLEGGCVDRLPGIVMCEEYHHNFCDTECWETAAKRGRLVYATQAVVEHLHHCNHKSPHDEIYALGEAHYLEDKDLYFRRRHLWA